MNMKLSALASMVAIAVTLGTQSIYAAPFASGEILFNGGSVTVNPASVETATAVTVVGANVLWTSGSFTVVPIPSSVDFGAVDINDPMVDFQLWAVGANSFTSTSFSFTRVNQGGFSFLNIEGNGIAYLDGFAPTPGTWTMTINQSVSDSGVLGAINFGASSSAAVPDGGTTVALLGAALSALALGGRKLLRR